MMTHDLTKTVIYGTPITPRAHLEELAGASFCISYATRRDDQTERCIELVGDDQILLVDNGAFSAWRSGQSMSWDDHWQGFSDWADDIAERCPQAVVVVPDVIDGTVEQNCELAAEFHGATSVDFSRLMVVWHLDEPYWLLRNYVEAGYQYIAIGSAGRFARPGTKAWHARIRGAFRALELITADGTYSRPHIHMMRAQAEHRGYPFDSSDSTNVAVNHPRYRHTGPGHVGRFAQRVRSAIEATASGAKRVDTPAELTEHEAHMRWLVSASDAELAAYFETKTAITAREPDDELFLEALEASAILEAEREGRLFHPTPCQKEEAA